MTPVIPILCASDDGHGGGVSCWPDNRAGEPVLPGAPLAAAIERMAAAGDDRDELMAALLERANVDPRDVYRWKVGEGNPTLSTVDRVLTRLGMFWWDVWSERSVREPVLVARTYKWRKFERGPRMICLRRRPYGDLGTDFWALSQVAAFMDPQDERAAA